MHIPRLEREDVVVVVQLTSFRAEAEIGDGGKGDGAGFEAFGPFVGGEVL